MAQKKLKRFAAIKTFPNVLEYPENMKGKWKQYFRNDYPVVLELACGKGEYATGLARMFPDRNFIGVDIKGNRLWVGATKAINEKLTNVAFLRTQIDHIDTYFLPGEVEEIWITFPDPQLRLSKAKKRLTHPRFLRLYHHIITAGAKIHLKTDSPDLYEFTRLVASLYDLSVHADISDVHRQENIAPELEIITHYEGLDIAKSSRIYYLCFSLPPVMDSTDDRLSMVLNQMK